MTEKPLSKTMASALLEIEHAGGTVERKAGGYWVLPGAKWNGNNWGQSWGTTTIEALVARNKLIYCDYQQSRAGRFPIRAVMVDEEATAAANRQR